MKGDARTPQNLPTALTVASLFATASGGIVTTLIVHNFRATSISIGGTGVLCGGISVLLRRLMRASAAVFVFPVGDRLIAAAAGIGALAGLFIGPTVLAVFFALTVVGCGPCP